MGGVGLLVLVGVLLAGGSRTASTVWVDPSPSGIDWDVSMSDPARACPGTVTTYNNYPPNGLIEPGECPDVTSTFRIEGGPAGTQSFFDRANAIWLTGPLGADQTGDGIPDAAQGLVPNRPIRLDSMGAKVGQILHLKVQSNLVVKALTQNNIDDVAATIDSTVTGQPLPCGAAGTLLLQDDIIELWNATTDGSAVPASETQKPDLTYPPGCDGTGHTEGHACAPEGVTMLPAPLQGLGTALGLPPGSLVSRSYGIARLPIVAGIESDIDVNFLVYRLHGIGINGYLALTLVQYPGLPSPDPTARGYNPLAQTLQTCPPYESTMTVYGVTSDADFNEDGMPDLRVITPELNRLVVSQTPPDQTYDYTLRTSMAADYDRDTIPAYADRCDTDRNSGSATDDTDGDTLTGTCDSNEGSNHVDGLWNAKPPWDAGQDVDGDTYLNYVDNCPTAYNRDQQDTDGDGVGNVCDPAPTIPGNGKGYPDPPPGMFVDYDDLCNDPWTVGASEGSGGDPHLDGRYCLKADGLATNWNDSNDNGVPDYLDLTALGGGVMADCNSDSDHDGLVDAVEAAPPSVQPCAPGIPSYGTSTDPLDPDTDSDGSTDGLDNCALVPNPGQQNADNQIGNGTGIPGHDKTVPNSAGDLEGDACETDGDADNDGLPDGSDTDRGGDITYDDNNNGIMCPTDPADDGPSWDFNCNGVRDGVEGSCPLATNPRGDDDADGLLNTWEVCKWGTDPNFADSDGDGIGDCTEAVDTNGNGIILGDFGGDALNSARATLLPAGVGPGKFGKDGDFDLNGNNVLSGDFGADTLTTAKMTLGILPCQ
jgi:hypothetical protein